MRLVPASPASATPKLNSRFITRGGWNDGYAHPCAPSAAGTTNPTAAITARRAMRRAMATGCESATGSDLRAALLITIFLREVWYARAIDYRNAYETAAPNSPLLPPNVEELLPPNSYPAVSPTLRVSTKSRATEPRIALSP